VAERPSTADSAIITDALTLHAVEAGSADLAFIGRTGPVPWLKAYGGDMVAQAVVAAMRSESTGKRLHSMHSYFLRPVEIEQPIRYDVELLRDGRGYGARQIRASQDGKTAYVALASFAAPEMGPQVDLPVASWVSRSLPGPEELPSAAEFLTGRSGGTSTEISRDYWANGRGFDMRHVPGPVYLSVNGPPSPYQAVWLKPFSPLADVDGLGDSLRDTAALAYVCDYTILEPALRALGVAWADEGLTTASLDHAMWFHSSVSLDDWVLYAQEAVHVGGGRGLALGRFYTRDFVHIATVTQEGLIRMTPPTEEKAAQ
jgi:acyl-CoA thioesterase-2